MEKKVYETKREKVFDFMVGFFGIPIVYTGVASVISWAGYLFKLENNFIMIVQLLIFIAGVGGLIYLAKKRKFMVVGFAFAFVVVPLAALGTCLLMMGGGALGSLFKR